MEQIKLEWGGCDWAFIDVNEDLLRSSVVEDYKGKAEFIDNRLYVLLMSWQLLVKGNNCATVTFAYQKSLSDVLVFLKQNSVEVTYTVGCLDYAFLEILSELNIKTTLSYE